MICSGSCQSSQAEFSLSSWVLEMTRRGKSVLPLTQHLILYFPIRHFCTDREKNPHVEKGLCSLANTPVILISLITVCLVSNLHWSRRKDLWRHRSQKIFFREKRDWKTRLKSDEGEMTVTSQHEWHRNWNLTQNSHLHANQSPQQYFYQWREQ
jgi:hypothetical protein